MHELQQQFTIVRNETIKIIQALTEEDCVVQPVEYVSPIKWHLAHTTWFFETFILKSFPNYQLFHKQYAFLFNSYYETEGTMLLRANRGNLTRPALSEIIKYREHVDAYLLLNINHFNKKQMDLLKLGLQHEQQHQELMYYDLKYILGHNPLFPAYADNNPFKYANKSDDEEWLSFKKQIIEIGNKDQGFCYDNELGVHEVLIHDFDVRSSLVSNAEYHEFIKDGAYSNFNYWLSEGWDWVKANNIQSPEYWFMKDKEWLEYELDGIKPIEPSKPVKHISFFEADAFARWKGYRLLTEFEWELAATKISYGSLWEWTQSAYLPYPGFNIADGAVGEYNGKFMINQKVLRGGSVASSKNHIRPTYRNFFHPHLRWMYSGIRLAR